MDTSDDLKPSPVPRARVARQGGEALDPRWAWVERAVWTDRMLEALQKGVRGNKWFRLIDKVYAMRNLRAGWVKVLRNGGACGPDGQGVEQFERHQAVELGRLEEELREGRYEPHPARRVYIPKAGSAEKRPLGIPAVRDRVVQAALRNVIEPIFERGFAEHSYGFRPGRSTRDALRRVERLLKAGFTRVVDIDLKSYFDTIPHERLMGLVGEKVADGRVLGLIESYLKAGVLETMRDWQPTDRGTPQGAVISPLLANIYLDPLDHQMEEAGMEMTRYADDMLIQCHSREEAERALKLLEGWVKEAGLSLHPEKTRIVDAMLQGGFDFLGYHFERGMRWPREKSMLKLRDAIRRHTPRSSGECMGAIIARINPVLRGWFAYFRHSKANTFKEVDGWVRGRLRSILRRRARRRGRGRGRDHQRWPNKYFEQHGLYRLTTAWRLFRQSRV